MVTFNEPITSANAMDIVKDFDIVVNGSDNFPTRYLVNDACYLAGKPLVDGTLFRFEEFATYVQLLGKGLLSLSVPVAATARRGAEHARRLGVLGRDVRSHRHHPGGRDSQAHPRLGRATGQPTVAIR